MTLRINYRDKKVTLRAASTDARKTLMSRRLRL
jgi:hypothetical protein